MISPTRTDLHAPHDLLDAIGGLPVPSGEVVVHTADVHKWFGRLHVLPVVVAFLNAFPEIDIRLSLADRLANLSEEHLDLALRIGELPDSGMIAVRLGSIRRVVCTSPAYVEEKGAPATPADLAHHTCIDFEGMSSMGTWTFNDGKGDFPMSIRPRLSVSTAEAAIDAAAAGLGVTRVLSYQIAEQQKAGTITTILDDFAPVPWPVSFVYISQGLLPLKLRAFLDFAIPRLRARLG